MENLSQAQEKLSIAIQLYNQERPHIGIGNLVPDRVHECNIQSEKQWKNYYQIKKGEGHGLGFPRHCRIRTK